MKKGIFIIIILGLLAFPIFIFAQPIDSTNRNPKIDSTNKPSAVKTTSLSSKLQNPLKVDSIEEVILLAVNIAIYIGVAFAILAIIFVGFKFVAAQGKPEEISKAREWFLWIVIGLAVLISARVIVEIIKNTLIQAEVVDENVFRKP